MAVFYCAYVIVPYAVSRPAPFERGTRRRRYLSLAEMAAARGNSLALNHLSSIVFARVASRVAP